MFKSRSKSTPPDRFDIFSKGNILRLTNPEKFQNTTIIPGSKYTPAASSASFGATGYFSGYVFRADTNPAEIIFKKGIEKHLPVTSIRQVEIMAGASSTGARWNQCICTHVCAQAAAMQDTIRDYYTLNGYIYLVDAMDISGFTTITHRSFGPIAARFPIMQEIDEVNFMHRIPNTSVIGAVSEVGPSWLSLVHWDSMPTELWLAVNPEYEGGMEGARAIVDLFNA
ncbi:hypothetical protein [Endozoicomonas euniceicola]|uniref:Uncharacterized protein n=1 Tax=Endozoicomonas euniceicola TaxID=1234143 RepID=A0ABY6GQ71_9GAMM|nr:hypothetical protein [Endozoicomonas euniceicola]UYM14702.1 hypothetical protein NX720_17650 [Endozoicomonas euniceicola]